MSAALGAAPRPAPSSKPDVVSGPAPFLLPVEAAAYRTMPLEAQAGWPRTLSTHGDPLLCFPGSVGRVGEQERLETVFTIRMRFLARLHGADERVELVAIGGLIALKEEVKRLIAGEAMRAGELDRRLAHIRGMNHTVHAMRLDPLIVAIRCAPRIGDLRDLAGRGLHDDDRSVDIADVANRLVDQRRPHRAPRHRLLAKNEPRQVKVVDHHVAKQAAGALDIGDRGRPGVARGD